MGWNNIVKAIDFLEQPVAEDFLEKRKISALEFLGVEEEAPDESAQALPARHLTKPPKQLSRDLMAQTIGQPAESVRLKEAEEVVQPVSGEAEPLVLEHPDLQTPDRTIADIPKAIGEFGDAILFGATLGLSKRAEQAGKFLAKKLFGDKYVEPPEEKKVLPSYMETAGELVGAAAPIGAAGKVIASPIIKIVSKSKYLKPFAKMIGWGTAGGAYSTAEQMINEGELPTPKEIAKHGAAWAAFEGAINSLGWGGRLALGINKLSKLWGIPRKEVLKTVIEEAKARNMPIAKYAYTKAGVQKALSKAEAKSAKEFVKNIENSAKKFEKRGTYQDLVNQLKDKEASSRIKFFKEYVKTGKVSGKKEVKPSKVVTKQPEAERILEKPGFLRTAEEKLAIQKAKAEPVVKGRAGIDTKAPSVKVKEELLPSRQEPSGPELATKLKTPAPADLIAEHKAILTTKEGPYKSLGSARLALKTKRLKDMGVTPETHEVIQVEGGFGIAPKGFKTKEMKLKEASRKIKSETPTMLKESDKIDQTMTLGTLVDIAAKDPAKALEHAQKATVSKVKLIEGLRNKGLKAMGKAKSKEERVRIAKNLEETLKGIEGKVKPKVEPEILKKKEPWKISDLADISSLSMRHITAKKQANGKFKLFYTGTNNEVFKGKEFESAPEARTFFKTQQVKAQEASRAGEKELAFKEPEVKQLSIEQTKPSEKTEKPIDTFLSSKKKAGVNYEMKVKVAETGEVVTVTKDAAEVLRETKKELGKYEKLLACLSS